MESKLMKYYTWKYLHETLMQYNTRMYNVVYVGM